MHSNYPKETSEIARSRFDGNLGLLVGP